MRVLAADACIALKNGLNRRQDKNSPQRTQRIAEEEEGKSDGPDPNDLFVILDPTYGDG